MTTIELTDRQAKILHGILANVGGTGSPRSEVDAISAQLRSARGEYMPNTSNWFYTDNAELHAEISRLASVEGSLYFRNDCEV